MWFVRAVNAAARDLIAALRLEPLPHEGGFYRQTWRSATSSAILFLLTPEGFSALHRLKTDEVWHFHAGDPIDHIQLNPGDRSLRIVRLGPDVLAGDVPQLVVPAGMWQGARIAPTGGQAGWSLVGCTLAPPWREEDFELGDPRALAREFPGHAVLVNALTR